MAEDEWERPLPTAQYAIGQQVLRERHGGALWMNPGRIRESRVVEWGMNDASTENQ